MNWKEPKIHAGYMETAVANLINPRINTIVPNVSWGLDVHECDMLVLDAQNRLTEIEIKISKSDLKADFKKHHAHQSKYISRLAYAVPKSLLLFAFEICPHDAGIISVEWCDVLGFFEASWQRQCRHNKLIKPIDDKRIRKLLELGCMRIWSLKRKLNSRTLEKLHVPS